MKATVKCPTCQATDLDVRAYDSMMVLRSDLALYALTCPHCATRISSLDRKSTRLNSSHMA